ncbi:uncharacterized protein [Notothenia coriiceps]|uniref:FAM20 C-terminal domain-containing protein n=1 Tax=Notothenia coriiceps TaxID=8208 RepID=A0A6I9PAC8_9TELE|nr:PREDICTED: uncharacterized protein LOC104957819 [Notothenia coriiceps]
MLKQNLGRSTRSIYLSLAFLSLALHLLLAFFCFSILQTACVPSSSSSSSSSSLPRTDSEHRQSLSHSSSSPAASSSNKLPTIPQNEEHHKLNSNKLNHKEKDLLWDATERVNKLTGGLIQKVKGWSKLEALFKHPLYNLPPQSLQDDDWLLRVKKNTEHTSDEGSEEEEEEDSIDADSDWESASEEKGYDKVSWTKEVETHPPWLRFHLGISRWELYDRKDPNLAQLTHYLARQRVLGAVQKTGGTQLKLLMSFPNYGQALLKPMSLLHLDNGRAFGRHSQDEPTILVPLKQCCSIRRSTLLRLRLLSLPGFRLSDVMRESLAQDPLAPLAPLLSEGNLSALDRRLASVLQAVQTCQEHHTDVIYNDLEGYDTINSMHEEQNNK